MECQREWNVNFCAEMELVAPMKPINSLPCGGRGRKLNWTRDQITLPDILRKQRQSFVDITSESCGRGRALNNNNNINNKSINSNKMVNAAGLPLNTGNIKTCGVAVEDEDIAALSKHIADSSHEVKPANRLRNPSTSPTKQHITNPKKVGKLKEFRHQCRDKPLYENCFLLGPDGQVLATVNRTKASWYIHKGLGEMTCEDPLTVKLFFEPSGRPMPDADYYTTIKENVCVVCEGTESFVRKMIIPHDYRRYFPMDLKDQMSHDVLLMCLSCHHFAQQWDEQLRQRLAKQYNAPLGMADQCLNKDHAQISKVRSAAKALHFSGAKIPAVRRAELMSLLQKHCGDGVEVTGEKIAELAEMKVKNENYGGLHRKRVVEAFVAENRLAEFIRLWRQHFLDNMKPKHLPPMWSVEHNLDKLRAKETA